MGSAELHIASLVVHAVPRHVEAVAARLAAQPAVQVHGRSCSGKLVVTVEADSASAMAAAVAAIQRSDGVLSALVVYQCADSLHSMNEELDDA